MPGSERRRELRRRRKRREKVTQLKKRAEKANASEKAEIADKLRNMTPGAAVLIENMKLESR